MFSLTRYLTAVFSTYNALFCHFNKWPLVNEKPFVWLSVIFIIGHSFLDSVFYLERLMTRPFFRMIRAKCHFLGSVRWRASIYVSHSMGKNLSLFNLKHWELKQWFQETKLFSCNYFYSRLLFKLLSYIILKLFSFYFVFVTFYFYFGFRF